MNRCASCAFRPGTEASQTPRTMLKARLCIMAREEFSCHESASNEACAGYLAALNAADPQPEWRCNLARELLELVDEAERFGGLYPEEEFDPWLHQRLGEMAEILSRKNGGPAWESLII